MRTVCTIYAALFLLLSSCKNGEKERIPSLPVSITFTNNWSIYGVTAPYEAKEFIKSKAIPNNFFYSVSSATGFGGVLITCGSLSEIKAFDLACPIEVSSSVLIEPITNGKDGLQPCALCPKCGSTYDIFEGSNGSPLSGPAREQKYFLRNYRVNGPTSIGSCTITN